MNTLDELFGDALQRESSPSSQAHRDAVAEVAVRGALRRRRVHATVQALGVVAVVALGAAVGSLVLSQGDVAPANPTPTPVPLDTPPSIIVPANLDYASVIDDRFPQAPAMSSDDWDDVTAQWDAEIVSFIGGGRATLGSVIAIYLTPPGGERLLAWATNDTSIVTPEMFYFDPASRTAALTSGEVINLFDGTVRETDWAGNDVVAIPMSPQMGRGSNGESLFYLYTVDSGGEYTAHVYRSSGDGASGIATGTFAPSPVWGDMFVAAGNDVIYIYRTDGSRSRAFTDLPGCFFQSWNPDGTFNVTCGATQTEVGETVRVDPDSGAEETLAEPPTTTAIDEHRAWGTVSNTNLPMHPPVLYEDGVEVANLADGFGEQPAAYGIIFGIRNP